MMKKVLISAPTAKQKNYCVKDWLENIDTFTYPEKEVYLVDNTTDEGKNANYLNIEYGVKTKWAATKEPQLFKRLAISHNLCREYAIENNFEWWLHLETDVFPPSDVIEKLLSHNKKVVGGFYYIKSGKERVAMIQQLISLAPDDRKAVNIDKQDEIMYVDGRLHKVYHIGLGCVLIHRSVFSKIEFRMIDNIDCAPDSFFAEDCDRINVPIYLDSSIVCEHRNEVWGVRGLTFT